MSDAEGPHIFVNFPDTWNTLGAHSHLPCLLTIMTHSFHRITHQKRAMSHVEGLHIFVNFPVTWSTVDSSSPALSNNVNDLTVLIKKNSRVTRLTAPQIRQLSDHLKHCWGSSSPSRHYNIRCISTYHINKEPSNSIRGTRTSSTSRSQETL